MSTSAVARDGASAAPRPQQAFKADRRGDGPAGGFVSDSHWPKFMARCKRLPALGPATLNVTLPRGGVAGGTPARRTDDRAVTISVKEGVRTMGRINRAIELLAQ